MAISLGPAPAGVQPAVADVRYARGVQHGAVAEMFGLGPRGLRWTQLVILFAGLTLSTNISVLTNLLDGIRPESQTLLLGMFWTAAFLTSAMIAVRSFQSALAVALATGLIYTIFTSTLMAFGGAAAGRDNAGVLEDTIASFTWSALTMFAFQFAVLGRRRFVRLTIGLFVGSVLQLYIRTVLGDGNPASLLAIQPAYLWLMFRADLLWTLTFWLAANGVSRLPATAAAPAVVRPAPPPAKVRPSGGFSLLAVRLLLSIVVLVVAGVYLRGVHREEVAPLGYDPRGVLAVTIDLAAHGYDQERANAAFERILQQFEALPGVQSVSLSADLPLSAAAGATTELIIEGRNDPSQQIAATTNIVAAGFFQTLRIPLLAGRDFTRSDVPGAPLVAIVNGAMASQYWPSEHPVGKRIRASDSDWFQIVGLVANVSTMFGDSQVPVIYLASQQIKMLRGVAYLRSTGDPEALIEAARSSITNVDSNIQPVALEPLEQIHFASVVGYEARSQFPRVLLIALAAIAVLWQVARIVVKLFS
jgi:hypothetical protein